MRASQIEVLEEEEEGKDCVNYDTDEIMSVDSTALAVMKSPEEIAKTGTNGRLEKIEETE